MGIALVILLPILFVFVATYAVLKLVFLVVRLAFAPARFISRW